MPYHKPAHKQPERPQTLAEVIEADRLRDKQFAEWMEYALALEIYQQKQK